MEIYQSIRDALLLPDGKRLSQTVERLQLLSRGRLRNPADKTVLCQFLIDLPFYRATSLTQIWHLPLTTNAVESMRRLLRDCMLRSSRAGSNPKSLLLWATALIRLRPTVTCNGNPINRNS